MKKIFNGEPFEIITHFDVDGAGGPLLIEHCYGKQVTKVYPCGYSKLDAALSKKKHNVFISDLSLTQEQIDLANKNFDRVIWFDHHEMSLNLNYPEHWIVYIRTEACATKLIYLWLIFHGVDLSFAKAFVDDVNDYDMWIHKSKSSIYLNNIFWDLMFWKFSKAFSKFKWDPLLWVRAKELQEEKLKEIATYETFELEGKLRVTFAKKHISDITLFYPKEKNHLIFRKNNAVSIRSETDLTKFYKQLNEKGIITGGHKLSGGIQWDDDPIKLAELFYNFIEDVEDEN